MRRSVSHPWPAWRSSCVIAATAHASGCAEVPLAKVRIDCADAPSTLSGATVMSLVNADGGISEANASQYAHTVPLNDPLAGHPADASEEN